MTGGPNANNVISFPKYNALYLTGLLKLLFKIESCCSMAIRFGGRLCVANGGSFIPTGEHLFW
jgi:hypothetical protein